MWTFSTHLTWGGATPRHAMVPSRAGRKLAEKGAIFLNPFLPGFCQAMTACNLFANQVGAPNEPFSGTLGLTRAPNNAFQEPPQRSQCAPPPFPSWQKAGRKGRHFSEPISARFLPGYDPQVAPWDPLGTMVLLVFLVLLLRMGIDFP